MAESHDDRRWYCVRTQPKHEKIAATHVRRALSIDVFNPKLRIRKATRRGAVWFPEALFPGYIFARFNWEAESQLIRGVTGVSTLVVFGPHAPAIPDAVIETLRSQFDENECHEVPDTLRDGDVVTIGGGPFHGLQATVLRVMSPTRRIQVLLEFIGGQNTLEVSVDQIARESVAAEAPSKYSSFLKETAKKGTRRRSQN